MDTHKITTTISTNNNLEYLKLAVKSIRQNAYYKDMPIIIHAENCNDGTYNWLDSNYRKYDLDYYVDQNYDPKGIGGGMDFCVDKVKTEFVNIIHSDMWIAPNQDLELLKLYDDIEPGERLIASMRPPPAHGGSRSGPVRSTTTSRFPPRMGGSRTVMTSRPPLRGGGGAKRGEKTKSKLFVKGLDLTAG